MKKILSVFLTFVMLVSVCPVAFAQTEEDISQYPVILVPGYSATTLYEEKENGEKEIVWDGLDFGPVALALLEDIAEVGMSIAPLCMGDASAIAKAVGENILKAYGGIKTDKNGKSLLDLKLYYTDPADCTQSARLEKMPEGEIGAYLASYLEKGGDNLFCFTSDFRMGAVECAGTLHKFINNVLDYTGAEKVNIFAVSHGGQVTGTYLSVYAKEGDVDAGKINNVVMTVPALGGAGFAYDALNGDVALDLDGIMEFVEFGEMMEEDYHWLLQADIFGFLDNIIHEFLPYVYELMGYWGSMWDFVPMEYYEDLKVKFFGDKADESSELIMQSDYFHYNVMNKFEESFASCEKAGANLNIIAGTGKQIVTGLQDNSDAIITTAAATGAVCADVGKRFNDGYVQKEDNGFYQVSPSMDIDASTGYLPFSTWYIEGLYHGMTFKDPYVTDLMTKLLFTERLSDVNADENYPQFKASTSNSLAVYARFNNSKCGYLTKEDTTLVVTNTSNKYSLKLASVSSPDCADIKFPSLYSKFLAPGESCEIKLLGTVPEVSLKNIDIIIDYVQVGSITPIGERVLNFTVMNGEAVPFDSENPIVDGSIDRSEDIKDVMGEDGYNAVDKVGVAPFLKILYNILSNIFEYVKVIINTAKNIKS